MLACSSWKWIYFWISELLLEHKQDQLLLGKFFSSSPSFTYFCTLMCFLSSLYEQEGSSRRSLLLDQHTADRIDRVRAVVFLHRSRMMMLVVWDLLVYLLCDSWTPRGCTPLMGCMQNLQSTSPSVTPMRARAASACRWTEYRWAP